MVCNPETLTLKAAIVAFYEASDEGEWTEMFRLARARAKADTTNITDALQAELILRLQD